MALSSQWANCEHNAFHYHIIILEIYIPFIAKGRICGCCAKLLDGINYFRYAASIQRRRQDFVWRETTPGQSWNNWKEFIFTNNWYFFIWLSFIVISSSGKQWNLFTLLHLCASLFNIILNRHYSSFPRYLTLCNKFRRVSKMTSIFSWFEVKNLSPSGYALAIALYANNEYSIIQSTYAVISLSLSLLLVLASICGRHIPLDR